MLCMLLCIACWLYAAGIVDRMQEQGRNIGLRYSSGGVSQESLNEIAFLNDDPLRANWLAWGEESGSATAEFNGKNEACTVLRVCGDPQLLYDRSQYRMGAAPLMGDQEGCAVSAALAYKLWRSYDVLDAELIWNGKHYFVRGVLREEDETLLLLQNDKDEEDYLFTAMEIDQTPNETGGYGTAEEQAQQFANKALLTSADVVIGYEGQALTLRQVALLPLLVVLILACWRIWGGQAAPAPLQQALRFVFIIGVIALGLWALSGWAYWPETWRPARWSYFDFWGEQWQRSATHTNALFALPGYAPDVARQKDILQALAAIVAATLLAFPVHSLKGGGPGQKLLFAAAAVLAAFLGSLYLGVGFQRPVWAAWPLYWCALALYALFLPALGQAKLPTLRKEDY